jgi:hypothetical protein
MIAGWAGGSATAKPPAAPGHGDDFVPLTDDRVSAEVAFKAAKAVAPEFLVQATFGGFVEEEAFRARACPLTVSIVEKEIDCGFRDGALKRADLSMFGEFGHGEVS